MEFPDELLWEYRLTMAFRSGCKCSIYLLRRGSVLLPEIRKMAEQDKTDPVVLFIDFQHKLHIRNRCEPI